MSIATISHRTDAVLLPLLLIALAACNNDAAPGGQLTSSPTSGAGSLIAFREVQCATNPWAHWMASHPGQSVRSDDPARKTIFESYWRKEGVALADARRERSPGAGDVVCQACNCPTGYDLVARVALGDVGKAVGRGVQAAAVQTAVRTRPFQCRSKVRKLFRPAAPTAA